MPASLSMQSQRKGFVASSSLALVALAMVFALVGCTPPHAENTTAGEIPSVTPATFTADDQPKGHVSADLPDVDPQVLVEDPKPQFPATVTTVVKQAEGDNPAVTEEIEVEKADRILTLDRAGSLSRIVWAFGMGDRLVGRDTSTDFPGVEDLPLVTQGGHSVNPEVVMSLNPDLIITDGSVGPSQVVANLESAGVTVVRVEQDHTPSTIGELITDVGSAIGLADDTAEVISTVNERLQQATEEAHEKADGRKMMMLYVRGTGVAMIAGPESGARELIQRLGGVDAGEGIGISGAWTPLTPEALINAAPDTFIVMTGGLESVGGIDGLREVPGVSQTPAGENGSVLDVPDSQLLSFGTQTPQVLQAMANALYGTDAN